ncbi:Tat pathway signal protein [Loktanella sp. 5RATIMAR09]|uniref:Tat pathway signal protein n=1 Tax=Loktanella sp. 5RATIMAR09 TaxID=1225655 RepID=UPI000A5364B7|nr:Tat pathway signal protein [Loktanella sp. 5RATIMAR09]
MKLSRRAFFGQFGRGTCGTVYAAGGDQDGWRRILTLVYDKALGMTRAVARVEP